MNTAVAVDTPESVGLSTEGLAKIDAFLRGLVDDGTLAGVVTLVARHGKTVHTSVMGKKDIATGEPLALDTIFRIFSMTKPVTGVAMSICHDEGYWPPDDPIAKHLPAFEGVRVFDGAGRGRLAEDRAGRDHAPTHARADDPHRGPQLRLRSQRSARQALPGRQGLGVRQPGRVRRTRWPALPLAYQPGTEVALLASRWTSRARSSSAGPA